MTSSYLFVKVEKLIVEDPKLLFTLTSYALALSIYMNLNVKSVGIGIIAFIMYFLINGTFLAHAFFNKEDAFLRLMLGILLLMMFLGFFGWFAMIVYSLDGIRVTLVLLVTTTLSSLSIKRMNRKSATC
ncbi:MAG: hypothetical protein ACFFDE_05905 [Promethearchaeota archaeon]